ncbi:hypothetical protein [Haloterrigena salifodinae]|uniref:hypothetical protein n=1 Tax=Haloterrigena salifodinae TaxID=2675099 RepID=UPI0013E0C369|nr:hypothetical protein [Haloterrigena salifodinae]
MSTTGSHDPVDIDRENARRAAVGLGIWLMLTMAAVLLLLLFGSSITSLLV